MGRPGLALVNMTVVEQRYRAVLAVESGMSVAEVAARFDVSRQCLHTWLARRLIHKLRRSKVR